MLNHVEEEQVSSRKMTLEVEVTDTVGGEANYCWVHRHTIEVPEGASARSIVLAAKKAEGWTGMRRVAQGYGDEITVIPSGSTQIMFIRCKGNTEE